MAEGCQGAEDPCPGGGRIFPLDVRHGVDQVHGSGHRVTRGKTTSCGWRGRLALDRDVLPWADLRGRAQAGPKG